MSHEYIQRFGTGCAATSTAQLVSGRWYCIHFRKVQIVVITILDSRARICKYLVQIIKYIFHCNYVQKIYRGFHRLQSIPGLSVYIQLGDFFDPSLSWILQSAFRKFSSIPFINRFRFQIFNILRFFKFHIDDGLLGPLILLQTTPTVPCFKSPSSSR